jgi:hypothetical protein
VEHLASHRVMENIGTGCGGDHDLGYDVLRSLYRLERP